MRVVAVVLLICNAVFLVVPALGFGVDSSASADGARYCQLDVCSPGSPFNIDTGASATLSARVFEVASYLPRIGVTDVNLSILYTDPVGSVVSPPPIA